MNNRYMPASITEAADALRECLAARMPLSVRGGQSHSLPVAANRAVVSSRGLNKIIEHAHEDLTVTVEAGVPLHFLQTALAQHGQWLPLEPPCTEASTIGGIVACGLTGASRLRYGPVRDHIIGMRYVCVDGSIARSGSKVVKSVAGYDLHKLLAGSRGTLAMIAEITFKVAPSPETRGIVAADMNRVNLLDRVKAAARRSAVLAVCISPALARRFGIGDAALTLFKFEGYRADVEDSLHQYNVSEAFRQGEPEFQTLNNALSQWSRGDDSVVRITGDIEDLVEEFCRIGERSEAVLDLGAGLLEVSTHDADLSILRPLWESRRADYPMRLTCVPGAKPLPDAEQQLGRALKSTFDPYDLLDSWDLYSPKN